MRYRRFRLVLPLVLRASPTSCEYGRPVRPGVLKLPDRDVVRPVNELPGIDDPGGRAMARRYAHDGLSHAPRSRDGPRECWGPEAVRRKPGMGRGFVDHPHRFEYAFPFRFEFPA